MSELGMDVVQLVMPMVRAWERLHDPEYCGRLTTAGFYDLMLVAGYSEDVAQEAARQHGWDRLVANKLM